MKRAAAVSGTLTLLILAGCVRVTKPPLLTYEEIPAYAWETLTEQRSFAFDYRLSRASMDFEVEGSGRVVLPDALRFKGTWQLGDEVRRLNMVAAGGYQLEKEGSQWLPRPKSEEAKILEQADRVIRRALLRRSKGFELVEDKGRSLIYSFKPNLAFLDPGFTKKFEGKLMVDGRTFLAEEIHAVSEDSDIQFDFTISKVNRFKRINIPFSPNFKINYALLEGRYSHARRILSRRLGELGRKSRIGTDEGTVEVTLTLPVEEQAAKLLGDPGRLVILGLMLEGEGQQINTRGELSDLFYVADTVAAPDIRFLQPGFDSLSRPVLKVGLAGVKTSTFVFDYLGVAVDGILYEVLQVDNPLDVVRITNVTTYKEVLAIKTKLANPMNAAMRYLSQERSR